VGAHSPWVQEVICGCGHEVLVANPRLMVSVGATHLFDR